MQTRPATVHTIEFGTPIFSPFEDEIWAYWAKAFNTTDTYYRFMTIDNLLAVSDRQPAVYFGDGKWFSTKETLQEDFANSHLFIMNDFQGPKACINAIDVLLNDDLFTNYFGGTIDDGFLDRLKMLRSYYTRK